MPGELRFRVILPVAESGLAAVLGGIGFWQRYAILSRPWFGEGQTLWDSTARFHVWPWLFKFAVVTNIPAFLSWALVGWPIGERWPSIPEAVLLAPSLLFAALLWYGVGRWLDRQWHTSGRRATQSKWPWVLLLLFTVICAAGASIPSTTAYLVWGVALWLVVGMGVAFSRGNRRLLRSRTVN
jgi:hypothetical protein